MKLVLSIGSFTVNKSPAELSESPQPTYKKIARLNQHSKQPMPKMTPHVNSLEDGTQQNQTSNTQVQQQTQGQQPNVSHALNSQPNQSSPAQNQQNPREYHQTRAEFLGVCHDTILRTIDPFYSNNTALQQTHPSNTNNIPPHNVQGGGPGVFNQVYQQPQFIQPNFIHSGHSGNVLHVMPQVPSFYFSNYTNVNVHGYHQMQQYVPNGYGIQGDGPPANQDQVRFFRLSPLSFCIRPWYNTLI